MIQWHYRLERGLPAPSKRDLEGVSKRWLATGETPEGYHIGATIWGRGRSTRAEIKRAMNGRKFGNLCPGIVSHFHQANVTLCDFDSPSKPSLSRVWTVARQLRLKPLSIELKRSSSGKGWHMIVTWDRAFSHMETVYNPDASRL